MKRLPPIPLRDKYYKSVQNEIERIFFELVYKELFKVIGEQPVKNSVGDALYEAIESGQVYIEGNSIRGQFNSSIGRIIRQSGGRYNKKSKTYTLIDLPNEYRMAQAGAEIRFNNLRADIIQSLDRVDIDRINDISEIPDMYAETLIDMERDFEKSVTPFAIPPQITIEQANIISAEWGANLDLYVRNWASENILSLRQTVATNAMAGYRASNLEKTIQDNYKVSKNKAKFLARQETALLMSKYHETRYKDLGVTKYIWSTSNDERVRQSHKDLDNKVILWDSPPVVDRMTGRTAHAGEDFGCRCVAIAVID